MFLKWSCRICPQGRLAYNVSYGKLDWAMTIGCSGDELSQLKATSQKSPGVKSSQTKIYQKTIIDYNCMSVCMGRLAS